ncbi:hypothetical protein [Humisphaera borealis]|uniref:Uncharacterized protein n=1 Tax=Humisphaera borealis TaxID=2807512 RepID=A0A7M2X1S6_9BACT|nr:hypothetical protein [Humisphaera borealis]QOV90690.1 hypothetical protein IPV69_04850 [Humisphaera borealis]
MIYSSLQRLLAGTLVVLLTVASAAPGGRSLVLCVAGGDHSHVFIASEAAQSISHVHDHGDDCDHALPVGDAPADACCDGVADDCHRHDCIDIALPGGDFQSQARKSSAQTDVGLPAFIASIAFVSIQQPPRLPDTLDPACIGSPPHLLRSVVLVI